MRMTAILVVVLVLMGTAQAWQFIREKDDLDDRIRLFATESKEDGYKYRRVGIACDTRDSHLYLYVDFDEYLSRDYAHVRYRIDDNKVSTKMQWSLDSKGTTAFAPSGIVLHLAKGLADGRKVIFEATDFRGTQHKIMFHLQGSKSSILKVVAGCNQQTVTKILDQGCVDRLRSLGRQNPERLCTFQTWK